MLRIGCADRLRRPLPLSLRALVMRSARWRGNAPRPHHSGPPGPAEILEASMVSTLVDTSAEDTDNLNDDGRAVNVEVACVSI